jgi:hypothetical protein
MTTQLITNKTYYRNGNKIRFRTLGGKFFVQKLIGGAWVNIFTTGEEGNSNNNFRFTVGDNQLKIQQLRDGGSWDGTEDTDFKTVTPFNR